MFDDNEREQVPLEARKLHRRLVSDSGNWARGLPDQARVAEFARTLPQRMPLSSKPHARNTPSRHRPSSTSPTLMTIKGQSDMFKNQRPRRTLGAGLAAVAVVALIVGLLYTLQSARGTPARVGSGPATSTVHGGIPTPTSGPQGDYNAPTPGPLANYVSKLYTVSAPPGEGSVPVTSHFAAGDTVYVTATVHGLSKGKHTISVRWYLNGAPVAPNGTSTSQTINGDIRLTFGTRYPTPGTGTVKLYIDRPANDTSESPSDPHLAGAVVFYVVATPPPTPTPPPVSGGA